MSERFPKIHSEYSASVGLRPRNQPCSQWAMAYALTPTVCMARRNGHRGDRDMLNSIEATRPASDRTPPCYPVLAAKSSSVPLRGCCYEMTDKGGTGKGEPQCTRCVCMVVLLSDPFKEVRLCACTQCWSPSPYRPSRPPGLCTGGGTLSQQDRFLG